jgi:transcriptional regulator with GAF, ATPase, and Fis domain
MDPKLTAIAGPLAGATFALAGEVTIGRDPSNNVSIADLSLSRRHCVIKSHEGLFKFVDLDSFNGSFVNGIPVKERALEHGDQIKVGDSVFVFVKDEIIEEPPASSSVQLSEAKVVAQSTVQLRPEDALYLNSKKMQAALPQSARMARDLNTLLGISTAINSTRDLVTLQQQLIDLTLDAIPAERAALLLSSSDEEEFASILGRSRSFEGEQVQVSRTIVRQSLSERTAVLNNDLFESPAFNEAESLVAAKTRSVMCVPLTLFDKTLGALYLDTTNAQARFDETHLQLATAIASIASVAIENARHVGRLEGENQRLQEAIRIEHNMVGESPRMRQVYQFIAKVAPTDSTVLVRGESGTGKELAAQAIHLNSPRAPRPFVAINCAALTDTLMESELFGHEKGAFTGAVAQKKGKLEVAEGGSVFLDEVGELAPQLQAKLLRALQERQFERVGGTRPIKVDIRLIAATNRDLEEAISAGSFRQDLYYRLNVVSFVMPPLRERREDVPLLANYFAAKYARLCKRTVTGISAQARALLVSYDWPGNVRELENAVERAVVLGSTDLVQPEDLPESLTEVDTAQSAGAVNYHEAVNQLKKQLILKAVEQSGGSYTEAARILGVHPNYLHRLIRNLNLKSLLKK